MNIMSAVIVQNINNGDEQHRPKLKWSYYSIVMQIKHFSLVILPSKIEEM